MTVEQILERASDQLTDTDTNPPPVQSLSGVISDMSGSPVEGANVLACTTELCKNGFTDETGAYSITNLDGLYAFKVKPPKATGLMTAGTRIEMGADEERKVDVKLYAPEISVSTPATTSEVELAPGLFVTFGADDLEVPAATDAEKAGGTRIALEDIPPIDGMVGTPMAAYYLAPWDGANATGLPFRLTDTLGLEDGETADAWVYTYETYVNMLVDDPWVSAGTLTRVGDELVSDGKLTSLSMLVIVKP